MSFSQHDQTAMRRALALAERGRGLVEPNPLVGAVLVRHGATVGEGWYRRYGGPHAEINALSAAGDRARGATLYCSLEPCDHAGKTPACAPVLVQAGVARVVVAALDPTAAEQGGGVAILRRAGVRVDVGLCREEAVRQNAGFFKLAATGRPLVTAKWAMSVDGKMATRTGESQWISSAEARRDVHRLRGIVDCIIVGAGTACADDPLLTCRDAEQRRVASRLVLCGRRAPRPDSRLVQTAREAPVLLAHAADAPPDGLAALVDAGCEALPAAAQAAAADVQNPAHVDLAALLDELGVRRMTNVLVEGGSAVLGSFMVAGLVDRVLAFVAPRLIGGSGAPGPVGGAGIAAMADAPALSGFEAARIGPDVLMQGWLTDPHSWLPSDESRDAPTTLTEG